MISAMVYLLLIASLLALAGHFGERIFTAMSWPRRGVWLATLAASIVLPALSILGDTTPPSQATPIVSLSPLFEQLPATDINFNVATTEANDIPSFSWPDWWRFNLALKLFWIASSVALLVLYLLGALRLHRTLRAAPVVTIGDQPVTLSDSYGPAVTGFFRPRIVLPRRLAEQHGMLRSQVLRHEQAHIAAHDQSALLLGLLLVATMPWNLALWWQLRRLRAAIEFDCDRRVLRGGTDPRDYAQALLAVGKCDWRKPFAAVALTEPVSLLEQRIRCMLAEVGKPGPLAAGASAAIAVALLVAACSVNAPSTNADQAGPLSAEMPANASSLPIRLALQDWFTEAQTCTGNSVPPDYACARRALEAARAMPNLNAHETGQLLNATAYLALQEGRPSDAIAAYENLMDLPIDLLPQELVSAAYRNLALLYAGQHRFEDGLAQFDRWLALPFVVGNAVDFINRSYLLFMLERYPEASADMERVIAIASSGITPAIWYEQLYALQSMAGDEAGAARTLAEILRNWPDSERIEFGPGSLGESVMGFYLRDGEYLPVIKSRPVYPPRALAERIEGHVIVAYRVTDSGATADIEVVDSSESVFDEAALQAVQKYWYQPRRVHGIPIDVAGIQTRIDFRLTRSECDSVTATVSEGRGPQDYQCVLP